MQETLAFRVSPKDHSKQQSPEDCSKTEHSAQEQFHSSRAHTNSLADSSQSVMFVVWGIFRNSSNFIKQWLPWSISNYSTTHEYC